MLHTSLNEWARNPLTTRLVGQAIVFYGLPFLRLREVPAAGRLFYTFRFTVGAAKAWHTGIIWIVLMFT